MDLFGYVQLLLKYRPRSEHEIRERLKSRGYDAEEIEKAILKLSRLDLINDFNFAKYWINYRLAINPKSQFYIGMELKRKGVSDEVIKEVFETFESIDDKELASKLFEKKIKSLEKIKDEQIKKRRAYSYLIRRGFKYGLIKELMQNFFRDN